MARMLDFFTHKSHAVGLEVNLHKTKLMVSDGCDAMQLNNLIQNIKKVTEYQIKSNAKIIRGRSLTFSMFSYGSESWIMTTHRCF